MFKALRPIVLFALLAMLLSNAPHADAKEPAPGNAKTAQTVAAVAALRQTSLTAFTRARHEMALVTEESGRVTRVPVDVGDAIGNDRIFARLDATFIALDIEANKIEQSRLKAKTAYLDKETSRYRTLVGGDTAAQSTLDDLEDKLADAQHELRSLKVEQRRLAERSGRHVIRAPKGWLVTSRDVEPGEWVSAGQTLGKAADYTTLLAPFALTPAEYQWVMDHKDTLTVVRADTAEQVSARLERVSPAFDEKTRKINVDLAVNSGQLPRRGGIRLQLVVMVPDQSGAVLLPRACMTERYDEYWLTREDGTRVKVVYLGQTDDGAPMVRVSSPQVMPGDRFLTAPPATVSAR